MGPPVTKRQTDNSWTCMMSGTFNKCFFSELFFKCSRVTSKMNESECYRFYFGQSTVLNVIEHPIRLGLIDLITITSLAIYLIFLIVTLPNAIRRFRRKKGSKALRLGYYIFIWADVVSRSIRQIIISAVYKGIPAEDGLSVSVRLINETVYFTSELGVMVE